MRINPHDPERQKIVTRRTALFGGGLSLLFTGVAARLYQLQVVNHDFYAEKARENQFNTRIIAPLRGEILDRFGAPLASNRKNFRLLFLPEQARDINAALDEIAAYVEISPEKRRRILRDIRRMGRFTPVELRSNLTWEEFSVANFQMPKLTGVLPDVGETRDYPYGEAASFVLGYVGAVTDRDLSKPENADDELLLRQPGFKVGRDGLERTYDKSLRGEPGSMNVEVNAHGRVMQIFKDDATPAVQGRTLALTIDADLQRKATEILAAHEDGEDPISGSVVVLDVKTGDVLVLASTPSFDPNAFNVGIDPDYWRALNESPYKPLLNKPLNALYPPGSTYKIISALAAMRDGHDPEEKFYCSGKMYYGKRYFHCWRSQGHGALNLRDSLKKSCDVYYYNLAKKLDIDKIADVARELGLGETHELGVPGQKAGTIPNRAWKRDYYAGTPENQIWFPGETLSVIIGQGAVTSTPLQLAVMAARVATGRRVRPRLVRFRGDLPIPAPEAPKLNFEDAHLDVVRDGMNAVTNEWGGTAARSRLPNPDWKMAGKTGTSQVYRITEEERRKGLTKPEDLPWERRDHALFVAFAPFEAPRYACAVVVEHGIGGSRIAGPKARDIMTEVMKRDPASLQPFDPRTMTARAGAEPEGEG
ncbi:MAG: penicillin-binding protein 2 [Pseudomonadota bacterium]